MSENMKNWCDNLRDLADFMEEHEDLTSGYIQPFSLYLFAGDVKDMAEKGRMLGASKKDEAGGYYSLNKSFGVHSVSLNILRDKICAKVQVGTKTVSQPDPELLKDVPLVEVEEPVYEWTCPDSVLSVDGGDE